MILSRYADAWLGSEEMALDRDYVLAFSIEGESRGDFHVLLRSARGAAVRDGVPAEFDIKFELALDFLRRLDLGEINALTAMGQARSTDPIPLKATLGERFGGRADSALMFRRLAFHFWTRDWPETVRFGDGTTRLVHGGNASVLIYDDQFRSAWYQLEPGMHINADARDQTNEHASLVIVTKGRFSARLAGKERLLAEGDTVLVPVGMTHEFWADSFQYGEFVWIAFGPGA